MKIFVEWLQKSSSEIWVDGIVFLRKGESDINFVVLLCSSKLCLKYVLTITELHVGLYTFRNKRKRSKFFLTALTEVEMKKVENDLHIVVDSYHPSALGIRRIRPGKSWWLDLSTHSSYKFTSTPLGRFGKWLPIWLKGHYSLSVKCFRQLL